MTKTTARATAAAGATMTKQQWWQQPEESGRASSWNSVNIKLIDIMESFLEFFGNTKQDATYNPY